MIHAGGAQLDGEFHAAAVVELIPVKAKTEPPLSSALQDVTRLTDGECATITEDVGPLGQWRTRIEHLAGNQVDVRVTIVHKGGRRRFLRQFLADAFARIVDIATFDGGIGLAK